MSKSSLFGPAAALGLARASSIAANLLIVPLALGYLGEVRYGLWAAITSSVLMLNGVADGGISYGLISAAARARAAGDNRALSVILSTGFLITTGVAVLLLAILLPMSFLVDWGAILEFNGEALGGDATVIAAIAVLALTLTMPVNVVLKFRMGLSRATGVGLWDAAAFASIVPALLLVRAFDLGIAAFGCAALLTPMVVKALGSLFFLLRERQFALSMKEFEWSTGRTLLGAGFVFFCISLTQAFAINADQLLIGIFTDVAQITPYAIFSQLFTMPYMVVNLFLMVLWPKFAARKAAGDNAWVRRTFYWTLGLSIVAGLIFTTFLYLVQEPVLNLWIGRNFSDYPLLLLGMVAYAPVLVVVGVISTLLVSLDIRYPQIYMNIAMMIVNLPLSIILIQRIGAAGAIWATVAAYILCICIPGMILARRLIKIGN